MSRRAPPSRKGSSSKQKITTALPSNKALSHPNCLKNVPHANHLAKTSTKTPGSILSRNGENFPHTRWTSNRCDENQVGPGSATGVQDHPPGPTPHVYGPEQCVMHAYAMDSLHMHALAWVRSSPGRWIRSIQDNWPATTPTSSSSVHTAQPTGIGTRHIHPTAETYSSQQKQRMIRSQEYIPAAFGRCMHAEAVQAMETLTSYLSQACARLTFVPKAPQHPEIWHKD